MAFEPFTPPPRGWAPETAGLTERQAQGIGIVVSAWAILEAVIQEALVRLAQSPPTLGQALTEDLGPDNRLKALRRLCNTWQIILPARNAELSAILEEVAAIGLWVEKNKSLRNKIAHWQWMRQTDGTVFGFKYSTKPTPSPERGNYMIANTGDFAAFAEEIREQASVLIELLADLKRLPAWPET